MSDGPLRVSRRSLLLSPLGLLAFGRGPGRLLTDAVEGRDASASAASESPKVLGVYWTRWNSHIPLTEVPRAYNVLYLFAARPSGSAGRIEWGLNGIARGIRACRRRGQRIVLSVGGAGHGLDFSSRAVSRNFVDSVVRIDAELGGTPTAPAIDGVDFNTFEADAVPNTVEYLWMFAELRRRFGAVFMITCPPAPWKREDKAMIRQALAQDLLTYAAPQFYDGPNLAEPTSIVDSVRDWVHDVAAGEAGRIVIGFGMADLPDFSTIEEIVQAWTQIHAEFPDIGGVYLWQHRTDADRNWAFAGRVPPLVHRARA